MVLSVPESGFWRVRWGLSVTDHGLHYRDVQRERYTLTLSALVIHASVEEVGLYTRDLFPASSNLVHYDEVSTNSHADPV